MTRRFFAILLIAFTLKGHAQKSSLPQLGKSPIDSVVAAMTLEEKTALLVGVEHPNDYGISSDFTGVTHPIPRLGIPNTLLQDGASGVKIKPEFLGDGKKHYHTGFPVSTALAATWNTDVVRRVGVAIAEETNADGIDAILAPSLNIHRNPLNGRNFEYYSEDPMLSGYMAAAVVQGVQSLGVGAVIKHFAANSQQTMRMFNDARISQRALREIYLRNFEIAIRESHPWAVMSSYNRINGLHTQYHEGLLTNLLRNEWGFDGIVMTDWTERRNSALQIHAGNDLLMGGRVAQENDIVEAVKKGTLSMADVDRNVRRVLQYIEGTQHFKGRVPTFNPDLATHATVSKAAAVEGIVMLKNSEAALPIAKADTVALFGLGGYTLYANGRGAADVYPPYKISIAKGLTEAGITLNPVLDRYYRDYLSVSNNLLKEVNKPTWKNEFFGYNKPQEPELLMATVEMRAKDCAKAIISIARDAGEAEDRDVVEGDYLLTPTERKLIENVSKAFHKQKKQVIVVLNVPGPMDIASWRDKVDGILLIWQPGQEGGYAAADILSGKESPSGKLPMTLTLDYFDEPTAKTFPRNYVFSWDELLRPGEKVLHTPNLGYTDYEEGVYVGYRYFDTNNKEVAYPFGFGLSYTSFKYDKPKVKVKNGRVNVSITVTNTGKVAGKEVVQLYATAPKGTMDKPKKELKSFAKTRKLQPLEAETVSMSFPITDLASFDENQMAWVTDSGEYLLSIGASVADIRATATVNVKRTTTTKAPTRL